MELQGAWDELKEKVAVEFEKNKFNRNEVDYRLYFRYGVGVIETT